MRSSGLTAGQPVKHVGLLTYQTGHLKTLQLTLKLLLQSMRVTLFAFPFVFRPSKVVRYADRPHQLMDFDPRALYRRLGVGYVEVGGWQEHHAAALGVPGSADAPDVFMTCIAKIVPVAFLQDRIILNAHPGLLPENRGVDAFKRCLINQWPFGCTLHMIDEQIDRGTILARVRIPVLPNDTFSDVCRRAYDLEVDLMAFGLSYLDRLEHSWMVGDEYPISHILIPRDVDDKLEEIFLQQREVFVEFSSDLSRYAHPADLPVGAPPQEIPVL